MNRRLLLFLTSAALVAGLAATGCNDKVIVGDEEQRIAVGVTPVTACPDPETELAEVTAVATIFAADGQVAENVGVSFSSDHGGTFDPPDPKTADFSGQAVSTYSVGRVDGEAITITGTLDSTGESDTAELRVPAEVVPSFVQVVLFDPPQAAPPIVGLRSATLALQVSTFCNLAEAEFTISWDPTIARISTFPEGDPQAGEPYVFGDALFDQADPTTADPETTLEVTEPAPGQLHVRYYRSDSPQTGFTFASPRLLVSMIFDGLAEGSSAFTVDSLRLTPLFGPDYPVSVADVPIEQFEFRP